MRRLIVLSTVSLMLASCAWTYRLNPLVGQRFAVKDFTEVVFYEGPSLNNPSFHLEKPEVFTVVIPVCPEGKFSCNIAILKGETLFFKVRFDSGKEAYISDNDFYKHFGVVKKYRAAPAAPKNSMICDPIPWKKGSFRCRME